MTQEQTQIPRYDYDIEEGSYYTHVVFTRTEDGEYCCWDDVEAEMNRLRQEIQELNDGYRGLV